MLDRFENLRGRSIEELDDQKSHSWYEYDFILAIIVTPLIIFFLCWINSSLHNKLNSIKESYLNFFQYINFIWQFLSSFYILAIDFLIAVFLIARTKETDPKLIPKLQKAYMAYRMLVIGANGNVSNVSAADKQKGMQFQHKIERMLTPQRRKYHNILGEYVYECMGPSFIIVVNLAICGRVFDKL